MGKVYYKRTRDGDAFSVPTNTVYRLGCCDCGLIHDIVIVAGKRKSVAMAVKRNMRATAGRRRNKRIKANIVELLETI